MIDYSLNYPLSQGCIYDNELQLADMKAIQISSPVIRSQKASWFSVNNKSNISARPVDAQQLSFLRK